MHFRFYGGLCNGEFLNLTLDVTVSTLLLAVLLEFLENDDAVSEVSDHT